MGESNEHQLWVNLSALGDGNIFAHLPQLMQNMLAGDGFSEIFDDEPFDLILPSDAVWQQKIYYQLVEKQRMADAEGDPSNQERMNYNITEVDEPEQKLHDWNIGSKKRKTQCCDKPANKSQPVKPKGCNLLAITWTVSDIAKAGRLLAAPPLPTEFEDEQEMRRVYTLIYDVFRYKNVLTHALNDVNFFAEFSQLKETIPHVWLLFYDLYHRGFKKRETRVAPLALSLFKDAGLEQAENCLWMLRVKLAAAVSRLRIEKSALSLNELLPNHLRDQRITNQSANTPVTCWVNIKKVKKAEELNTEIQKTFGLTVADDDVDDLNRITYKWDRHCPQIIAFHSSLRPALAKSELVRNFKLVVQDKSFCLGPATFGKLVADMELTGSVIQTHVNSPRTTAYLATILSQNERIKKLMAFSAGKRKLEYEDYLQQLGMTNVKVFADKLIDISPDSHYMEEVVAVFATPPNSYSAVNDPIDLVCSRGGDLSMLEVLTESEESKEGHDRVCSILDEQRRTLRFAMSRPQIQFVLYETHSELDAENNGMVQRTVKEVNRTTKLHHAALQGRIILSQQESQPEVISVVSELKDQEINNNEDLTDEEMEAKDNSSDHESRPQSLTSKRSHASIESEEKILEKIAVPDTDVFATPELPNLCPSDTSCLNLQKEGCYLALLQRKQVIRLDNKYMIQMAENRGLFGRTSSSSSRMKSKGSRKKQQKPPTPLQKTKRRIKDSEVARIATPTHTFLRHTKDLNEVPKCRCCCSADDDNDKKKPTSSIRKLWWAETTRHLGNLRTTLIRKKLLPPIEKQKTDAKAVVDTMVRKTRKIDEIVAEMRNTNAIPVFPKLRLTRENKVEKVMLALPVTTVRL